MPRLRMGALALVAALVCALPGMASGAITIGATGGSGMGRCIENFTWVQAATAPTSPSYAVPAGGGVITQWSHQVSDTVPTATLRLKVFRETSSQMYRTVGHSAVEPLGAPGLRSFLTQISVQAGDVLGLRTGTSGSDCVRTGQTGDVAEVGLFNEPDPLPGATFISTDIANARLINLSAVVEPDCDGDGLGDETQDPDISTCAGPPGAEPPPDTDPPQSTITKDAPKKTDKRKAKFKFVSDEPGSTFECALKGRGLDQLVRHFNPCTSPRRFRSLDPGRFKFQVRAIDPAGNVDPTPAKDKFKVVGPGERGAR